MSREHGNPHGVLFPPWALYRYGFPQGAKSKRAVSDGFTIEFALPHRGLGRLHLCLLRGECSTLTKLLQLLVVAQLLQPAAQAQAECAVLNMKFGMLFTHEGRSTPKLERPSTRGRLEQVLENWEESERREEGLTGPAPKPPILPPILPNRPPFLPPLRCTPPPSATRRHLRASPYLPPASTWLSTSGASKR